MSIEKNNSIDDIKEEKSRGGQVLKMHLLESRLLDTFFKNVICSTQKVSNRQTKVCCTCTTFCFRAVDKKIATAQNFEQLTKFLRQ